MGHDVVLVSMPWLDPRFPSPALGLVHALIEENNISVKTVPLHLTATEFFSSQEMWESTWNSVNNNLNDNYPPGELLAQYTTILGEYYQGIFANRPLIDLPSTPSTDPLLNPELLIDDEHKQHAIQMREHVDLFLESGLQQILIHKPKIVGFSITFTTVQLIASLNMAKRIKEVDRSIVVVFGGGLSNVTGESIFHNFTFIDVLVRGRIDKYIGTLFSNILNNQNVDSVPGLCSRLNNNNIINAEIESDSLSMDSLPTPNYNDYFEHLNQSVLKPIFRDMVVIPFETSKGCWWGEKHQCNFCGLNLLDTKFNSKSSTRVHQEIIELSRRYERLRFASTDCILDYKYFDSLLPMLENDGFDFTFSFEVKSNLKKSQIAQLARSGVRLIQPGIESLSTPILILMNKGVSAFQNIRLLKWCCFYNIKVVWNLLYGFPGEDPHEYLSMASFIPSIFHLDPPTVVQPISLVRNSPYYDNLDQFAIQRGAACNVFHNILNLDTQSLIDLSPGFKIDPISEKLTASNYATPVINSCKKWRNDFANNFNKLRYYRGPDFIIINDERLGNQSSFHLTQHEAEIYSTCDDGASILDFERLISNGSLPGLELQEVLDFLSALHQEGLLYIEGDRYLSLALPSK